MKKNHGINGTCRFIFQNQRQTDKDFLMPVEDVFSITGRELLQVELKGIINSGDAVDIIGMSEDLKSTITEVEMFRKILDKGQAVIMLVSFKRYRKN